MALSCKDERMKKAKQFLKCEWNEHLDVAGPVAFGRIGLRRRDRNMEGKWQK